MRGIRRVSYSAPDINRTMRKAELSFQYQRAQQRAKSQSFQEALEKLPQTSVRKALFKIGIASHLTIDKPGPSESQRKQHRQSKSRELTRTYQRKRIYSRTPFKCDLDDVVLDCYKYGERRSSAEVWKLYKQNCKNLAYRTQRVLNHKGIFSIPV